jgi:hypothetical protein
MRTLTITGKFTIVADRITCKSLTAEARQLIKAINDEIQTFNSAPAIIVDLKKCKITSEKVGD